MKPIEKRYKGYIINRRANINGIERKPLIQLAKPRVRVFIPLSLASLIRIWKKDTRQDSPKSQHLPSAVQWRTEETRQPCSVSQGPTCSAMEVGRDAGKAVVHQKAGVWGASENTEEACLCFGQNLNGKSWRWGKAKVLLFWGLRKVDGLCCATWPHSKPLSQKVGV